MWYMYAMDYYSVINRNKIKSFVEMWMDLETLIQSEVSQKDPLEEGMATHSSILAWRTS